MELLRKALLLAEQSRKYRQRTVVAKEECGNVLAGDVAAAEVDSGQFWRVLKDLDVTCVTFAEATSAGWSAKEGCGNVLTGAPGVAKVDSGHFWRVLKHLDVTCETFAEASSAVRERRVRECSTKSF